MTGFESDPGDEQPEAVEQREPCIHHAWTYRRGTYYGERAVFMRCRDCKAFRWTIRGKHLERRKGVWGH